MSGSVNKVILVGNLGRDPEIRAMQSGDRVCNLSLATSERWRDRDSGEQQERTEWHRVAIFDQQIVEVAERYLRKGAKVYVEGQLQTRKYTDSQGVERYSTEVVLRRFRGQLTMLDTRAEAEALEAGGPSGGPSGDEAPALQTGPAPQTAPGDIDDDIPF